MFPFRSSRATSQITPLGETYECARAPVSRASWSCRRLFAQLIAPVRPRRGDPFFVSPSLPFLGRLRDVHDPKMALVLNDTRATGTLPASCRRRASGTKAGIHATWKRDYARTPVIPASAPARSSGNPKLIPAAKSCGCAILSPRSYVHAEHGSAMTRGLGLGAATISDLVVTANTRSPSFDKLRTKVENVATHAVILGLVPRDPSVS